MLIEHEEASKKFKDWGVIMRPTPVRLEGPVYKRETILLGNSIRKLVGVNMEWGMDVAKNAMFSAVSKFICSLIFMTILKMLVYFISLGKFVKLGNSVWFKR